MSGSIGLKSSAPTPAATGRYAAGGAPHCNGDRLTRLGRHRAAMKRCRCHRCGSADDDAKCAQIAAREKEAAKEAAKEHGEAAKEAAATAKAQRPSSARQRQRQTAAQTRTGSHHYCGRPGANRPQPRHHGSPPPAPVATSQLSPRRRRLRRCRRPAPPATRESNWSIGSGRSSRVVWMPIAAPFVRAAE